MDGLEHILSLFESTHLKEIDTVRLMDRFDSKFIFKSELLPSVLKQLLPFYTCLQITSKRISKYKNLYYDTSGLMFYEQHHNGKLNRYKVRHRTYVDSNLAYLEVKFKNNKGRTLKKRIKHQNHDIFETGTIDFLSKELPFDPLDLKPVLWINYSRITLVSKKDKERLTLDLNLEFKKGIDQFNLNGLVIAEIKQEKPGHSSFLDVMKNQNIRQGAISKYCMAVSFTISDIKKNNFKENLLALKQIITNDPSSNIYRNINRQ